MKSNECLKKVCIFLFFIFIFFLNEKSTDMLEYQSREEGYPDLELEENFNFSDDRKKNWKAVIVDKKGK